MNKNFTAICASLLLCAILIVFMGGTLSKTPALADATEQKVIYLTFDDGPSDKVTPKILDILKSEDVKATFFIIGKNAETRKNLIEREISEGHTVAVHSYSHDYKSIYASPEALISDIAKCNSIIKEITGKPSALYRFPGGSYGLSTRLIDAVCASGMRYVDWNASVRDAEIYKPTPAQLLYSAINTPSNRARIVLLAHDSTTKSATAEALTDIIRYYKSQNYAFEAF